MKLKGVIRIKNRDYWFLEHKNLKASFSFLEKDSVVVNGKLYNFANYSYEPLNSAAKIIINDDLFTLEIIDNMANKAIYRYKNK